eukprot:13095-Heterococcus_DN1.PRE.4
MLPCYYTSAAANTAIKQSATVAKLTTVRCASLNSMCSSSSLIATLAAVRPLWQCAAHNSYCLTPAAVSPIATTAAVDSAPGCISSLAPVIVAVLHCSCTLNLEHTLLLLSRQCSCTKHVRSSRHTLLLPTQACCFKVS